MNLKEQAISVLEKTNPLVASLLAHCELKLEAHKYHPTIHLSASSPYHFEMLQSKAMWPKIHSALMGIIKTDFTLNFEKGAQHGKET